MFRHLKLLVDLNKSKKELLFPDWQKKQPFIEVIMKRRLENMQQIYRTPMPKCNFNKVAKQLYSNHTLAWMF